LLHKKTKVNPYFYSETTLKPNLKAMTIIVKT